MKYEVKVKESKGSCATTLFEKMAKNGDITAKKVTEVLGTEVTVKGYAKCHITSNDTEFDINYVDTEELGLISSGSEIFINSILVYYPDDVQRFTLTEIKTKRGKTYKAVPILTSNEDKKTEEITNDDLPF